MGLPKQVQIIFSHCHNSKEKEKKERKNCGNGIAEIPIATILLKKEKKKERRIVAMGLPKFPLPQFFKKKKKKERNRILATVLPKQGKKFFGVIVAFPKMGGEKN